MTLLSWAPNCCRSRASRSSSIRVLSTFVAHPVAEVVALSLRSVAEGLEKVLYETSFTYFGEDSAKSLRADLLLRSVFEDGNFVDGLLPPLSTPDEVRDYDMHLTEALNEIQLPEDWNMVGTKGRMGRRISTVNGECFMCCVCGAQVSRYGGVDMPQHGHVHVWRDFHS